MIGKKWRSKIDKETHNYSAGAPIYPGRLSVSGAVYE
jgi:hypothetical protein